MAYKFTDNSIMRWLKVALSDSSAATEVTAAQLYAALELYYLNNGLYDAVTQASYENSYWIEGLKPLRNPAHRVVEFYVARLWPGALPDALPITAENKAIIDPIHKIWEWSNWSVKKQLAARWFSLFGDWFCKVTTRNDDAGNVERVYLQTIKPNLVTDFSTDERDFLTYMRLDIPQTRRLPSGKVEAFTHVEVWEKDSQSYRLWETDKAPGEDLDRLGAPISSAPLAAFGIDFIPFVHAKFQDIGEDRGIGAFTHALDKIDEGNRQATRIAQMLFRYNRPTWAVSAGGMDATGRPLPAPRIGSDNAGSTSDGTVTLGDDTFLYLPGNSTLNPLVPPVNYGEALEVLKDHMLELERDLPELAYYRIRDLGDQISGRAVRYMLSDAIDKVLEARGNAESALIRAHQMALTIAAAARLDGFTSLGGTFEEGAFDHQFEDREVIPLSDLEEAEVINAEKLAGIPLKISLLRHGWTEDEVKAMEKAKTEEQEAAAQTFGNALLNQGRGFDQGNKGAPPNRPPARTQPGNPQPGKTT